MNTTDMATKYGVDEDELLQDVLGLSLAGKAEFDKSFNLRVEEGHSEVFTFNATVKAACTVADLLEVAASPRIIGFQNKSRRGKKENLEQALFRLRNAEKDIVIEIRPLAERIPGEVSVDKATDTLLKGIGKMDQAKGQATAAALLKQLRAMGFDPEA